MVAATVKPGGFRWVDFPLPQPLTPGKVYFVMLPATPKLCWRIYDHADGERVYGKPGAWTTMGGAYALKPFGTPRKLGRVGPEAAVDGLAVPLEGQFHQWRSDPAQELPQWLEVDFGKTVTLNTVHLTFDTNLFGRFPSSKPGGEATADDYWLLYNKGGKWEVAFAAQGNWRRFRRHQFPAVTTDKIRLEILKAKNGREARVYEIRAYKE